LPRASVHVAGGLVFWAPLAGSVRAFISYD
ncbi:MAG: hypothetical protein ACI9OF_002343, partial [Saprospiraceae bacterium]